MTRMSTCGFEPTQTQISIYELFFIIYTILPNA
jgi:hypothetical protein